MLGRIGVGSLNGSSDLTMCMPQAKTRRTSRSSWPTLGWRQRSRGRTSSSALRPCESSCTLQPIYDHLRNSSGAGRSLHHSAISVYTSDGQSRLLRHRHPANLALQRFSCTMNSLENVRFCYLTSQASVDAFCFGTSHAATFPTPSLLSPASLRAILDDKTAIRPPSCNSHPHWVCYQYYAAQHHNKSNAGLTAC